MQNGCIQRLFARSSGFVLFVLQVLYGLAVEVIAVADTEFGEQEFVLDVFVEGGPADAQLPEYPGNLHQFGQVRLFRGTGPEVVPEQRPDLAQFTQNQMGYIGSFHRSDVGDIQIPALLCYRSRMLSPGQVRAMFQPFTVHYDRVMKSKRPYLNYKKRLNKPAKPRFRP